MELKNLSSIYSNRRKEFAKQMVKESFAIISTTELSLTSITDKFNYRVPSEYLYLTGLTFPIGTLVIAKSAAGTIDEQLFIAPIDPDLEQWDGKMLEAKDAANISGISTVRNNTQLASHINALTGRLNYLYVQSTASAIGYGMSYYEFFVNNIKKSNPSLNLLPARTILNELRWAKDQAEIDKIERAIDITNTALINLANTIKVGAFEYEYEAILSYNYRKNGADHAFFPIVAGGINSTVLHYNYNQDKLNKGEVLLVDTGARWQGYNADITRTYPIGGKFSQFAEEIYLMNLEIHKKVINEIKVGQTLQEIFNFTSEFQQDALLKNKLIKDRKDFKKYTIHNLGHPLGLDVHDPMDKEKKLAENSIITVEPGLYFPDKKTGVRIEDNLLLSKKGNRNLSSKIAKELKDIYKLCS